MKKILSLILMTTIAVTAMAVPARRGPIIRTTEDGTEKVVYLHGNEWFHYMTDAEGQWLNEKTLMPLTDEQREARLNAGIARKARRIEQQKNVGGELNLAPRGLIILVNFTDKKFKTEHCDIQNMINGEHFTQHFKYKYGRDSITVDAYGSARKYFECQSDSQYLPQFDVVGPIELDHDMAYYGGNDSNGDDKNVGAMIKEACVKADQQLNINFKQYDNNEDGDLDFVYVIYAGYGEADGGNANTIWPHNWDLTYWGVRCEVDKLMVHNYACSNEMDYISRHSAGIGTFCHEFSHVLGLPDLYATNDNATHKTMGAWDILDYGPYNNSGFTPPGYSAYERFYMGWLTPRLLTEPASEIWLGVLSETNDAILICDSATHNLIGVNPHPATFYMLENRQNQWNWDLYLPGNGLLITKIQYSESKWSNNTVNNNSRSMGVDIIEADGSAPSYNRNNPENGYYGKATDAFPAGATEWTGFAGHEITNIVQGEDLSITFSYRWEGREGIENVKDGETATKILRDGQVLIIRNGVTYNAQGAVVK